MVQIGPKVSYITVLQMAHVELNQYSMVINQVQPLFSQTAEVSTD